MADPAVAFTLPAWACDFWCQHKSSLGTHLQLPLRQCLLLAYLCVMHGEGQVPVLMSF